MKKSMLAMCALCTTALFAERPRLFVLTDITNEPDDEESLVRLLAYANEYEIEGIVATTSSWFDQAPREDRIRATLDAYELAVTNFAVHAGGYPTADALRAVTAAGQSRAGINGLGTPSAGSRLLAEAAKRRDERNLHVAIWGGANTFTQAMQDLSKELSPGDFIAAQKRLLVYAISDQDNSAAPARHDFPYVTWIVDPSYPYDWREYYKATWNGMAGDVRGVDRKLDLPFVELADNEWLKTHVMDKGPLGKCYPPHIYSMEGDTPSFLGLIDNGLGWRESPAYGGWGGRYEWRTPEGESRPVWATPIEKDVLAGTSRPGNSVTRWREDYQLDFAGRMQWAVSPKFEDANHNPVVVLNGDATKKIVHVAAKPGEKVFLSAAGSTDPDGDSLEYEWFIYREASSASGGEVSADGANAVLDLSGATAGELHVVLRVRDNATPRLASYRRAIVSVE